MTKFKPIIIAGPCLGESKDIMMSTAQFLREMRDKLDFDLYFKSSFDKANRSSVHSFRSPGSSNVFGWFAEIKEKLQLKVLTDIHETHQAEPAAEVCDVLQIPAFLARQTDLLQAASRTKRIINIKKGQFMNPLEMMSVRTKILETDPEAKFWLTERGTFFGYGDLIVDMRSFKQMQLNCQCPIIYDMTHSVQKPASFIKDGKLVSGADRSMVPSLARSAAASSYIDGFFLEVHPDPKSAASDADAQLNFAQARDILEQCVPLLHQCKAMGHIDASFV